MTIKPMPQETQKCLILDIGSNSVIGMFCDWTPTSTRIFWEMRFVTGLGKGLVQGENLSVEAQARTLSAIDKICQKAATTGPYRCLPIGTEALRRAANANDFMASLKSQTAAVLRILSPEEELYYEHLAFKLSRPAHALLGKADLWLIDLGGASCEVTAIDKAQNTRYAQSFSLGLMRLQTCLEECLIMNKRKAFNAVQNLIRSELDAYLCAPLHDDSRFHAKSCIFSGSLPLAFAQQLTKLEHFDPNAIEQLDCLVEQLNAHCHNAAWPPLAEEKLPLLAALSLRELLAPSVKNLQFSTKGIRHGLLLDLNINK